MRFLSLRALFLLGFVVAMPVLALPPVARWMDELLYGTPPGDFGRPSIAAAPPPTAVQPLVAEPVLAAGFAEAGPAAAMKSRGLESPGALPPLSSTPAFAPVVPPSPTTPAAEPTIDERTLARLHEVRDRLEKLGAEYIVVETVDGSGQFCFRCRMRVEAQSRFSRSFEATAAEPIAAAEHVLRDVEGWRTAAAEKQTRQQ